MEKMMMMMLIKMRHEVFEEKKNRQKTRVKDHAKMPAELEGKVGTLLLFVVAFVAVA